MGAGAALCFDVLWIFLFLIFQFLNVIPKRMLSKHLPQIKDGRFVTNMQRVFSLRLERERSLMIGKFQKLCAWSCSQWLNLAGEFLLAALYISALLNF